MFELSFYSHVIRGWLFFPGSQHSCLCLHQKQSLPAPSECLLHCWQEREKQKPEGNQSVTNVVITWRSVNIYHIIVMKRCNAQNDCDALNSWDFGNISLHLVWMLCLALLYYLGNFYLHILILIPSSCCSLSCTRNWFHLCPIKLPWRCHFTIWCAFLCFLPSSFGELSL